MLRLKGYGLRPWMEFQIDPRSGRYTKRRRPVEYALVIPAADRSAALREEARIKKLTRAEKLALVGARP